MQRRDFLKAGLSTTLVTGTALFAAPLQAATLKGQEIDHIQVRKSKRKMDLISREKILKSYGIKLGHQPQGHKRFQGDGKTPEGHYWIDRRNPNSAFHLSLGISYPNSKDAAFARSQGRSPGGNIFIHGQPNGKRGTLEYDWTRGCIAVSNSDMEEIWSLIPNGMRIYIFA